jgi:predicted ATP-dependent Lon-type protease
MNVEQAKAELKNFIDSYANDEVGEFTFIQKKEMLQTLEDYMAESRDEEGSEALELSDEINNYIEYYTTFDELRDKMFEYAINYCSKK